MARKPGLGKGLGALIPEATTTEVVTEATTVTTTAVAS